jgi:hypothetical protein
MNNGDGKGAIAVPDVLITIFHHHLSSRPVIGA